MRKELRSLGKESSTRLKCRPRRRVYACGRNVLLVALVKKKLAGGRSPQNPESHCVEVYRATCWLVGKPNTGKKKIPLSLLALKSPSSTFYWQNLTWTQWEWGQVACRIQSRTTKQGSEELVWNRKAMNDFHIVTICFDINFPHCTMSFVVAGTVSYLFLCLHCPRRGLALKSCSVNTILMEKGL